MEGVGIGGKCAMTKEKSGDREMVRWCERIEKRDESEEK